MKSSIDNKCPRGASHLKTKAKKNALMEERFAQIETENRILLEKMSHIMRVSSNSSCVTEFRRGLMRKWLVEINDTIPSLPTTDTQLLFLSHSSRAVSIAQMTLQSIPNQRTRSVKSESYNALKRRIGKF